MNRSHSYMTDWIFCTGSGLLSTSIGLNAVSSHGTCTAVFVAGAAIVSFSFASIRTLGKIKWTAWAGVFSIFTAGKLRSSYFFFSGCCHLFPVV